MKVLGGIWGYADVFLGSVIFKSEKYWSCGIFPWNQTNATKSDSFTKTCYV